MRLSIIPSDNAVVKDAIGYINLSWEGTPENVHALQWLGDNGWIELIDSSFNQSIDTLPQWANNALDAWTAANTPKLPEPPTAEQNKATASEKLYKTDWTTIPDVSDPVKSNPYLTNADAFIAYRNKIRLVALNPVNGEIAWPDVPQAIWS